MVDPYRVAIRFSDTDTTGRVYFTSYVRWIDEAIIEFLRDRGMTYSKSSQMLMEGKPKQGTFVIGEYHCRIERPSGYDDELDIQVSVGRVSKRTITFEAEVTSPYGRHEKLAKGWITYVYVDNETHKSKGIPLRVLQTLGVFRQRR